MAADEKHHETADAKPTDAEMIDRFLRTGTIEVLDPFFQRHQEWAYRLAFRLTGSAAEAEDVLQTACLTVLRSLPRYDGRAEARAWIGGFIVHA